MRRALQSHSGASNSIGPSSRVPPTRDVASRDGCRRTADRVLRTRRGGAGPRGRRADRGPADLRPYPEANSIAWLAWHAGRGQDAQVADVAGVEQVWTAPGVGGPVRAAVRRRPPPGTGTPPTRWARSRRPVSCCSATTARSPCETETYLRRLTADDLDRVVDVRWDPPVTLGVRLVSIVGDSLQHAGQASYVRGLLEPSRRRLRRMRCAYFDAGVCRSCTWMGRPHGEQVADKERHCLNLLGERDDLAWLPPVDRAGVGVPQQGEDGGRRAPVEQPTLGILDAGGHGVDLQGCGLYPASLAATFPVLAAFVTRANLTPYDVPARTGELKNLLVTQSPDGELMVRFVLRSQEPVARIRKHLPWLLDALPQLRVVVGQPAARPQGGARGRPGDPADRQPRPCGCASTGSTCTCARRASSRRTPRSRPRCTGTRPRGSTELAPASRVGPVLRGRRVRAARGGAAVARSSASRPASRRSPAPR